MGIVASTITFTQAQTRVAQAAGTSTADELTRAGYAVQAALQDWNNRAAWPFTQTLDSTISVVSGIAAYTLPANFKQVYDIRLNTQQRPLRYLDRRLYDWSVGTQTTTGVPEYYSLYSLGIGGGRQITLIPTPSVSDTLYVRYYRALTIPSSGSDVIDIPVDYENYLLAWAKYLYLLDKGGPPERLEGWRTFAENGMRMAMASEIRTPDEMKLFIPAGGLPSFVSPNSLTYTDLIDW